MNRDSVVEAIGTILREEMNHPHLDRFGPEARLNEDLYLDSVQLLQLMLALEMNLALSIPEEAISRQDVSTVADLAALLLPDAGDEPATAPEAPSAGVHGEMPYDLKIHCFVSCLCDGLKTRGIDHRPFYFLIWDAEFAITDGSRLAYHSDAMDHESFRYWFERLYGVPLHAWYDHSRSKDENVATLLERLERRGPEECIMVMLDMFHLPERENKFNQNPFPHYLMVELTEDPALWQVRDPDFRWEGLIERDKLLNAIRQPSVAGGYQFDPSLSRPPADADLAAFFEACFRPDANPLIDAARAIVSAHAEGRGGLRLADLGDALRELPVITIRKWAYEHGFAFFWRALAWPDRDFQRICDEVEVLVNGLTALHYAVLKLAKTEDSAQVAPVLAKLDALDAVEFSLKRQLGDAYAAWREARPGLATPRRERRIA
jgi:acyl carrier protein